MKQQQKIKWYRRIHFYQGRAYYYDFVAPDMEQALVIAANKFVPRYIIGELEN